MFLFFASVSIENFVEIFKINDENKVHFRADYDIIVIYKKITKR